MIHAGARKRCWVLRGARGPALEPDRGQDNVQDLALLGSHSNRGTVLTLRIPGAPASVGPVLQRNLPSLALSPRGGRACLPGCPTERGWYPPAFRGIPAPAWPHLPASVLHPLAAGVRLTFEPCGWCRQLLPPNREGVSLTARDTRILPLPVCRLSTCRGFSV